MQRIAILAILGLFVSSNALACGWGAAKTAASEAQQTVMSEPAPATGEKPTQPKS